MLRSRSIAFRRRGDRISFRQLNFERLEQRSLLNGESPPFDVLVFHETAGFRHDSISAGVQAIQELGELHGFAVQSTGDSQFFNAENLAPFEAVVFLNTTGNVLNDQEQSAFEEFIQNGGGFVGVHAAADTEYSWPWYGDLVGAYFQSHPQIQEATVVVADRNHPSTAQLPDRWVRTDEWYNYRANPRGDVHVLATLDERTYQGGSMGFDHPISWAHEFDGGRAWYTGLGHTRDTYSEPLFLQHLLGGIQYAAGVEPADTGATIDANYEKVVLETNVNDPMQLDVAPDGRVFFVERGGRVKVYVPESDTTEIVGRLNVYTGQEDGLLGIVLDPNFAVNSWLYLFYSPTGNIAEQRVSRFTVEGNSFVSGSERILLHIPTQRTNCCHSAGSLGFGPDGSLYISTGDDTNPFASSGFAPIDERPGRSDWDAQKSASNADDLRGKILRILPQQDGTYAIPEGNLFPADGSEGRPEIFVMGNRNPFRFSIDTETGWLYWGDVGPDASNNDPQRGPRGYDEINQARGPGNFGWPYFIADNKAYRDYNFGTGQSGALFDPVSPMNESPNNTGPAELPPAQPAWIWYPYAVSQEFPELGAGGRTAMAGPVYHAEKYIHSEAALPEYFDDTLFIYEWSRGSIFEVKLDASGGVLKINPFLASFDFRRPMDMKIGHDGAMYLIEWGSGFGGGNSDAQLVRIEYNRPAAPPMAAASANRTFGAAPLEVQFSSTGTTAGSFGPLTYAWDFDGDGSNDSSEEHPSFTYSQPGLYSAVLTVTDQNGQTSASIVNLDIRLSGDVNGDGNVDLTDFGLLKDGFGRQDVSWENGDLDLDGDVDLSDFQILKAFFGQQS